jgi:hypothetical protein
MPTENYLLGVVSMRKKSYYSLVQPRLEEIEDWRTDGQTLDQIAENLGIHIRTLNRYIAKYTDLKEVMKQTKDILLNKLKKSLYQRAMGYEFIATSRTRNERKKILPDGTEILETEVTITENKRLIYSDKCLIFALTNLDPENWKHLDKTDIDKVKELIQFIDVREGKKPPQIISPKE